MSPELDNGLVIKYPKIFKNRYGDMMTTAMCWGFECGDGWYDVLNHACSLIQSHIDWNRTQRARVLQFNRCLNRAINGDKAGLVWYYTYGNEPNEQTYKSVENAIEQKRFQTVPNKVVQVIADQIKEKFGTLRFYYSGGDDFIRGIVSMAESMSSVTCEECGNLGECSSGGWIRTLCKTHREQRE